MEIGRFPNRLKSLRRSKGLSRKKVAKLLGYADTSTLSIWERGITLPGTMQTFQLARLYNVMPHELLHALWLQIMSDESLLISSEMFISNSQNTQSR